MLPFILGGVALAVTGYGIGKLFEDDVPCSKGSIGGYSQSDLSDVMDRFECSDRAIDFIKVILPYLLRNSLDTASLYDKSIDLKESESEILQLLPQNFKRGEAVKIVVEKLSVSIKTVDNALKRLLNKKALTKIGTTYSIVN